MDEKAKAMKAAIRGYEAYAKKSGFSLNPNPKYVEAIVKGLLMNEEKKGRRYCPCRPLTGNKQDDDRIVCPCAYHKDEIRVQGKCHCGLFVRAGSAE